jgi:Protein of unknown function (DUF3108)
MKIAMISRGLGISTLCLMSCQFRGLNPVALETRSATPLPVQMPVPSSPLVAFEVGESFSYKVSWKIFDAGIATLTLADKLRYQNEEVYKITATARSTGIVSTLFKVFDVFESYLQARDLCSRKITKNIREGRRHRDTVVNFDLKARQARMEDRDLDRPDLPPRQSESPIPHCVQDVISALYLIRTKNLKVGERLNFPINDGGKTYDVDIEIQATETIKTPAGMFQTLRLEPKIFDGLFSKKGRMFVWITTDSDRVPVQLKAKINIGTITAALTKVNKVSTPHPPSLTKQNPS